MDFQEIEVLGISIEKDQITKEIHSSIWHLYEVLRISRAEQKTLIMKLSLCIFNLTTTYSKCTRTFPIAIQTGTIGVHKSIQD
jgi:hypothetical protein